MLAITIVSAIIRYDNEWKDLRKKIIIHLTLISSVIISFKVLMNVDFVNQRFCGILVFLFFSSFLLAKKLSPVKNSLFVIFVSLLVRLFFYKFFINLFPCCRILISFSSGMMIIFCYCSIMRDFDRKNNFNFYYSMSFLLGFSLLFDGGISFYPSSYSVILVTLNPFLFLLIGVVILVILCINKRIFNPKKSFLYSY